LSSKNLKIISFIFVFFILCLPASADAVAKVTIDGKVVASASAGGGTAKASTSSGGVMTSTSSGGVMTSTSSDGVATSTSIIDGVIITTITTTTTMKKGENYKLVLNTVDTSPKKVWTIEYSKGLKLGTASTEDTKNFVATQKGEQYIKAQYQSGNMKQIIQAIITVE